MLAAGAWTNALLQHLGMQLDLEVWRVHWGHARVAAERAPDMPQWFCFRWGLSEGREGA